LAGPVVVAGVRLNAKRKMQNVPICRGSSILQSRIGTKFLYGIKDSKKLSAKKREEWFGKLMGNSKIEWAVAKVGPKVIDRINIQKAANLGAMRVYRKLSTNYESVTNLRIRRFVRDSRFVDCFALLDGSLYLPKKIPHKTIIRGDEKIPVISAASIIAKVTRDRLMVRLHKKYPKYRFDIHKGYGTKLHKRLIKKHGISEIHRKSFRHL